MALSLGGFVARGAGGVVLTCVNPGAGGRPVRMAPEPERKEARTRCDQIFIGTRGNTAAANLLLGSVATKVLHISNTPVLLVR